MTDGVVLGTDDFQFVLTDSAGGELRGDPLDGNTLVTYDPEMMFASVLTSEHWGPVHVTADAHFERTSLEDSWEDVVEFSITCEHGLAVGELAGDVLLTVIEQPGSIRVRVCARGRDAGAALTYDQLGARVDDIQQPPVVWHDMEPDDDTGPATGVLEHFQIQAWPAPPADAAVVRITSRYGRDQLERPAYAPPVLEHDERMRHACTAMSTDLLGKPGARTRSGALGVAQVQRDIPGTPRKMFSAFVHPHGWMTRGSMPGILGIGNSFHLSHVVLPGDWTDAAPEGMFRDEYIGDGYILCTWQEVIRYRRVVFTWNWWVGVHPEPPPGRPIWPQPGGEIIPMVFPGPFLPTDTLVTITLEAVSDPTTDPPRTRVQLTHGGLPIEWLDDMTAIWNWQLERAEKIFDVGGISDIPR